MKFIGNKGQSSSVFQLLIAAVVAGAILVVLFTVLGGLPGGFQEGPNQVTSGIVKNKVSSPGDPQVVETTFKKGNSLSAITIASGSGSLGTDQVCVNVSEDFSDDPRFDSDSSGVTVNYLAPSELKVKLYILCGQYNQFEGSEGYLDLLGADDRYGVSLDGCREPSRETATFCLVSVVS